MKRITVSIVVEHAYSAAPTAVKNAMISAGFEAACERSLDVRVIEAKVGTVRGPK